MRPGIRSNLTDEGVQMFRKIIAATAVTGVLALGGAGVASAATSTPSTPTTPATHCDKAPKALARIAKFEARADKFVTNANTRLATAKSNNNVKAEDRIEKRINRVEKWEAKGTALQQKINAKCPGVTAAS
jgi:hypothetical protein